jgi:putative ABC transport system substrate-binding protein
MQKPKNLLLIIPLGSPYLKPDLPKVNSAAAKLLRLVFRNVVVQYDHAADLVLATISLTIPRRVSANASRIPFGVSMPRYWRAIASGVYPASVNSSASETRIRVPLKIKRPLHTRVSAAKCLPISIRAISVPPRRSLYQLTDPIKSSPSRMTKARWLQEMHNRGANVESGALQYYGINLKARYRCAAIYVNKIEPADLPVEQPRKFELVINLKTAKQIGLTIPQKVLVRADRVIK